jgi:AcrR family transcriptional regulator
MSRETGQPQPGRAAAAAPGHDEAGRGAVTGAARASTRSGTARTASARAVAARAGGGSRPRRPSLGGGTPALERELGAQGRQTVRKLLEAGLAEFDERGFQAVRVDDVVRRARTSHGTFYLYFANKDDLFRALLRDALHDMQIITDDFPVVTRNEAGKAALRAWVLKFCDTYSAHATVIRILSQAEIVGETVWGDGLQLFFHLAETMTQGMTAGARARPEPAGQARPQAPAAAAAADEAAAGSEVAGLDVLGPGGLAQHAELTAVACLMMLERVNYLLSVEVRLPREEMAERLSAIIFAAFHSS